MTRKRERDFVVGVVRAVERARKASERRVLQLEHRKEAAEWEFKKAPAEARWREKALARRLYNEERRRFCTHRHIDDIQQEDDE